MMEKNIFELKAIKEAREERTGLVKTRDDFKEKVTEGIEKEGMEILSIPTLHIPNPKYPANLSTLKNGKVLSIDWGGTNFRATIVEFKDGKATIIEEFDPKKVKAGYYELSAKVTSGYTRDNLYEKMAGWIEELNELDETVKHIGYCFSYPAAARLNGDAVLLRWTKGMDIPGMVGEPVGEPLLKYLNNRFKNSSKKIVFDSIKVINDTIACLFAGFSEVGYDSYIGLIVGTGTNMACLMPLNKIAKLNMKSEDLIPVNLESGNFNPPYLTIIDRIVDAISNNKGSQRFEKAVSGGYLADMHQTIFNTSLFDADFNGGDMAKMINDPEGYDEEQVKVAKWIFDRSAQLVAATIAGLVQVLVEQSPGNIKKICLAADGSVFWGKDVKKNATPYKDKVSEELKALLPEGVTVTIIDEMKNPNMVGAAISALI